MTLSELPHVQETDQHFRPSIEHDAAPSKHPTRNFGGILSPF